VKDRKKYKQTLTRFTRRMRNAKAYGAFISWGKFVSLRKRLKYLAQKIFNKLTNGKLYGAWQKWSEVVDFAQAQDREQEELMYMNKQQQEKEMAKREEAERKNRKGMELIQRMMHGCLATTLQGWKEYAKTVKKERVTMKRFLAKMSLRAAAKCFPPWLEVSRERCN